jgi:hypothetical protein
MLVTPVLANDAICFVHSFERCVSRVIYKRDWATARPAIMKHNKWPKCALVPPAAHRICSYYVFVGAQATAKSLSGMERLMTL